MKFDVIQCPHDFRKVLIERGLCEYASICKYNECIYVKRTKSQNKKKGQNAKPHL